MKPQPKKNKLTAQQEELKTKLKPIIERILKEQSGSYTPEDVTNIVKLCNRDIDTVSDLFLDVLSALNYNTLSKYLGRVFVDLAQNGYRVEKTKLYNAGY